jgi:hypothetical protein
VLVAANGNRLWFDLEGPALVPDGPAIRERPTVVLLHGSGSAKWLVIRCVSIASLRINKRELLPLGCNELPRGTRG